MQIFNLEAESQVSTYINWSIKFISLFAEFLELKANWLCDFMHRIKREKTTPFLPQDEFPFDVFIKGKDNKDDTIRI